MKHSRLAGLLCVAILFLGGVLSGGYASAKGRPFITKWAGKKGEALRIPLVGEYTLTWYNAAQPTERKTLTVRCLDASQPVTLTPDADGEYIVTAEPEGVRSLAMGAVNGETCTPQGSCEALRQVIQFGDVVWQDLNGAFAHCSQMTFAPDIDTPKLAKVRSMAYMFYNCLQFNHSLATWEVSRVEEMGHILEGCTAFDQPLGGWKLARCRTIGIGRSGLSRLNYSKTLEGWAEQSPLRRNIACQAEGLHYNYEGKEARAKLVNAGWRISGDEYEPPARCLRCL